MTLRAAHLERLKHERGNVQIAHPAAVGDLLHAHVSLARHSPGPIGLGLRPAHAIEVRCRRRLDRSGGQDDGHTEEEDGKQQRPVRHSVALDARTFGPSALEPGTGIDIPPILSRRARRRAPMRTIEPRRQQPGRLRRRWSVERHERGRDAGSTHDVGAPPILGDAGNFDQIGASPNGFFKAMHRAGHQLSAQKNVVMLSAVHSRPHHSLDQAKTSAKTASTVDIPCEKKKFWTRTQQVLHRTSTGFPQPVASRNIA